eukprot:TRINITY_DN6176_c0_g1_i1.p1 TRINITY_DN6176_c0_g1~~TRINITY_DN6176_c0_g1_i1.p1  ORF type:complete len:343 (-),score=86.39 TRINITY_DN6176_c0_g1_i1:90-1118(-)
MFSVGDGVLEERLLDLLGGSSSSSDWNPEHLLVLRTCSRSWRDKAGPLLLSGCAERLASEDAQVRLAAMNALSAAANTPAPEEAASDVDSVAAATALAAAVKSLEDQDVDVRRVALRTLAHVAQPGDQKAIVQAIVMLCDIAWPVRWAAVDAVAWLTQGGQEVVVVQAVNALTERLEDKDWPVRRAAARGLNNLVCFLDAAASMANDSEDDFEGFALPTFGDIQDVCETAVQPTTSLLFDAEEEVRVAAAELLPLLQRQRGHEKVVAALLVRIEGEERLPRALSAAFTAIGQLASADDAVVLTSLRKQLSDRRCQNAPVKEALENALDMLKKAVSVTEKNVR